MPPGGNVVINFVFQAQCCHLAAKGIPFFNKLGHIYFFLWLRLSESPVIGNTDIIIRTFDACPFIDIEIVVETER